MSSISCLVAQLTVMLGKSMPVFFSRPSLFLTFSPTVSQMHVVFSESVFTQEIYCTHLTYQYVLFCVLYSVCWPSVGPQNIAYWKNCALCLTLSRYAQTKTS